MARHGDTRSPSPVGSSHSSKRNRRADDHYERSKRDDVRGHRRRSRTRSPDVRVLKSFHVGSLLTQGSLNRDVIEIEIHIVGEIDRQTDEMKTRTD